MQVISRNTNLVLFIGMALFIGGASTKAHAVDRDRWKGCQTFLEKLYANDTLELTEGKPKILDSKHLRQGIIEPNRSSSLFTVRQFEKFGTKDSTVKFEVEERTPLGNETPRLHNFEATYDNSKLTKLLVTRSNSNPREAKVLLTFEYTQDGTCYISSESYFKKEKNKFVEVYSFDRCHEFEARAKSDYNTDTELGKLYSADDRLELAKIIAKDNQDPNVLAKDFPALRQAIFAHRLKVCPSFIHSHNKHAVSNVQNASSWFRLFNNRFNAK